ncbi:MAG TPA: Tad domain-containing protein, partial [Polyangia bacterium]|nr:Tad domain-containing protein [Polyangia bacterium]
MKNKPMLLNLRDHERGAVAIVVAFTWTALFGMAVLAIDFGYLYAKRRGLQAAADGLLKVSMPDWVRLYPSGWSTANNDATTNAASFYVTSSEVSTTENPGAKTFTVTVSRTYPTFIGGIFGMNGKTVTASATGQMTGSPSTAPAILALGGVASVGVKISGNTTFTINGDVQSNGPLDMCGGPSLPYTTNGNVQAVSTTPLAPSVCSAAAPPIPGWATWDIVTGTIGTVGSTFADPFGGAPPPCTGGTSLASPLVMPPGGPGPACPAGTCYIPAGVYCSNGAISITPADPCNCIETDPAGGGVTFVSSGPITIGGSGGV